jgi:maltose alpha-D-glucosyltransferase/alpha-amylase
MLNWTERMVRMRKEVPEVGWGEFAVLVCDRPGWKQPGRESPDQTPDAGSPEVLALRYDWRSNAVVFLHNLSPIPREVTFETGATGLHDGLLVNLLSNDHSEPDEANRHCVLLEPYGYRWFRVGGLDYLLRRSPA